ncbi:glycosyltransferase family 4 protein [Paucilactobacillus wasatchensis]|uniref:Glycosyltransferase LafA n=1 Tax=Paucilactobacillus wasatchensis TaxID=1335616 RepID=A0A0D0Y379_9LACO|nr:glycosyltransferase family 4 protein [Paucilactobacillus wasatchensis]KIS02723.1 Glycosyltransferase LafA [Paucilactobacillus wasatchensis]
MNIGLFTDTYFPQVSGVATSIKTLRDELTAQGNNVYIFTTTDPKVDKDEIEPGIFRVASVPFVSFTDRRIAIRGLFKAYRIAKELDLDVIHNQTEFSLGWIGKVVARALHIPCVHTYHTMYQDYLHYIANGRILKPKNVKQMVSLYLLHMTGVIAPSERVLKTLESYGVKSPIRIIPTGVDVARYQKIDNPAEQHDLRQKLGYTDDTPVILSLSRLAFEKNIHELIEALPDILVKLPTAQLLIVGDGPAKETLENQVAEMKLTNHVTFTGEVNNNDVYHYYQMADVFAAASDSESQGLTYIEALASNLPIVVMRSPYTDELIDDPAIGHSFQKKADLVADVVNYLTQPTTAEDTNRRAKKLDEISAESFAKRVLKFYRDSQITLAQESHEPVNLFRGPRG